MESWITVKDVVIIALGAVATGVSTFAIKVIWSWNEDRKVEKKALASLQMRHRALRSGHRQLRTDVDELSEDHKELRETVNSHGIKIAVIEDRSKKGIA